MVISCKMMNYIVKNNITPLCFLPSGDLICYQYGKLIIIRDEKIITKYEIIRSKKERYIGRIIEADKKRVMIKYVILLVELLLLSSCGYNMESENESNITKKMRSYISNNVEGSYGFFECNMVKEHIDSLCWKTDIYRIQQQIELYASQRRTIIANSYVPVQIDGWPFPNKFDLDFVSPQGYGKRIHESYITKEEREVCDYVYYKESVPEIRKNWRLKNFVEIESIMLVVIELHRGQLFIGNMFCTKGIMRICFTFVN